MENNLEVLWANVLIKNPFYKKNNSAIHVEASVKENMIMTEMAKTKRLPVFAVGNACTKVKSGDEVYVEMSRLMASPRVAVDEDTDYFIVRETDIVFIYKDSGFQEKI